MERPTAVPEARAAVDLVRTWLAAARHVQGGGERRDARRLHDVTRDRSAVAFTMAFADRAVRPDDPAVAAAQLRKLVGGPLPAFLSPIDRALLRAAGPASVVAPRLVMALARRRLRQLVGGLVADRRDPALASHIRSLRDQAFDVNANLLGELVLGHDEAARRRDATIALVRRDDVGYVSVKASAITAQLNVWAQAATVDRIVDALRPILRAAAGKQPPAFVNLDMEEYRDLRLTMDAFCRVLDEPELASLEAGIVLQAYLPDAVAALDELTTWAQARRSRGGAGIKVRIVKGANLAMERVDAASHGWEPATYGTKLETDANFLRLLDTAFDPSRVDAVRIGVGSHNLFDVAWAHLLAARRGVQDRVDFEMLQGMAPAHARTVRDAAGGMLLYTPIVDPSDFDTALAYLFRRLEENSGDEHFLRHLAELDRPDVFADERARFEASLARRHDVSTEPRRHRPRPEPESFANAADTDPTDPDARRAMLAVVADPPCTDLPAPHDPAGVDAAVRAARLAAGDWRARPPAERRDLLRRVADELDARRHELVAVMVHEAAKTVAEADTEVSEAVDFARYDADLVAELTRRDGARPEPLGTIAVVPPWNFPVAIPIGGVLAALAAGNAVVLKPAPQTPRCAWVALRALRAAGVPTDVVRFVHGEDEVVGTALVTHPGVDGIVLTGSTETAALIRSLAPTTALFAETSGKNAIVVMPDADLDLAVTDVVRSAFGHAGQKCSAASLAILVGSVATSDRFRRQLADATRSVAVGPASDPATAMGPLVGEPPPKLRRALTTLEPGQRWLVQPRQIDPATHLWSPGVIDGVEPGSWFHRTECFGPVLGLMRARDLDEAIELQNATTYGLTGGIQTLDPANAERWLDRVQVGNAYVNRAITGAIVRRQPFGGWKGSVVGPGAKAGGPEALAQLVHWHDGTEPVVGAEPSSAVAAILAAWSQHLDDDERRWLHAAARSDAHWWRRYVAVEHDPSGLAHESNVLRFRPIHDLHVRTGERASPAAVARVLAAAACCGISPRVSAHPALAALPWRATGPAVGDVTIEPATSLWQRLGSPTTGRVRLLGERPPEPDRVALAVHVDDRPPVASGRVELLRYVREQSVSRTLHRFGNLVLTRSRRTAAAHRDP